MFTTGFQPVSAQVQFERPEVEQRMQACQQGVFHGIFQPIIVTNHIYNLMQQTKLAGCGWRIQMTTNTVLHTFARAVVAAKDGRDIFRRNQKERLGYQRKLGANFGLDSGVYGRNDPLLRS